MNQDQKQFLINWFRGWLPQEPRLRQQVASPTTKPINTTRANILNSAVSLTLVFGLLASFFLLTSSWIQEVLITIAIISGLVYVLGRRRPRIKRAVIKALIPVMIFALCFTGVEVCLFWNASYPPTYSAADPKISLTLGSMLNSSVVEIVQKIEQTQAFNLLKLEYGDRIRFSQMSMDSWQGGEIQVTFVSENGRYQFQFDSSDGSQYRVHVYSHNTPFFNAYGPSNTTIVQSLEQIDSLGLSQFYNKAVANAENKTASLPAVNSVTIALTPGDNGLTVQVIGYHVEFSESGGMTVDNVFHSSFRPNAELQYMN
jgi:ABC-type multidrug transport system fused ATPase/permease subunit